MRHIICVLFLVGLIGLIAGKARADEFRNVQCGAPIPKALIGQRTSDERVVAIENRYKALGLKDLGADEISDRLSSISWLICGGEYMLLVDRGVVRDVLPFPPHSKAAPAFSGRCQRAAKDLPDVIVAVLNFKPGAEPLTPAAAWTIDQAHARFVALPTEGLLCPRSGIITADGGT